MVRNPCLYDSFSLEATLILSGIGTAAASAQATIGNVVAPSLFATLTSAGAGGYGVAAISGAVQWAGGTMVGLAGATGTWLWTRA